MDSRQYMHGSRLSQSNSLMAPTWLWILVWIARSVTSLSDQVCIDADPQYLYRHPHRCDAFIRCQASRVLAVHQCPKDLFFDESIQTCNNKERVHCLISTCQDNPTNNPGTKRTISQFDSDVDTIVEHIHTLVDAKEKNVSAKARTLRGHLRPFRFVQSFLGNRRIAFFTGKVSYLQETFLKYIKDRYALGKSELRTFMQRIGRFRKLIKANNYRMKPDADLMELVKDNRTCPYPIRQHSDCDRRARFRTIDGSCNNLKNPLWGRSFKPLLRVVRESYEDGISSPRRFGVSGRALKSAREVSLFMMPDITRPTFTINVFHMTFGQFLDHDLARTAMTKLMDNEAGEMKDVECGLTGCETSGVENEACLPIPIPEGDRDFQGFKKCLMFVRSQSAINEECCLGSREQLNQVTSYLDASLVYGNVKKDADDLRNFSLSGSGRLLVTPNPNPQFRDLLPQRDFKDCRDFTPSQRCFKAGDGRVNEQVALMAVHTVFMRYHNYLVERLRKVNPWWDGERLYQESRRILTAIWQYIVYSEYLPPTLGPRLMHKHGLNLLKKGYYYDYDDRVNADTENGFQTAAFRFGHSQVTNTISLANQRYTVTKILDFSEVFNRPREMYNNDNPAGSGVDAIMLGQLSQDGEAADVNFAKSVSARLFSEKPTVVPGTDLPSLNIQRGREHGLPGYAFYREWCGLGLPISFDDLRPDINDDQLVRLQQTYEHVHDVDIFVGGLAETPVQGALVGPTFGCMIASQFRKARAGDRYWHERWDPVFGFTPAQLKSIRTQTLARMMCDTLDNVDTIPKFVMLNPFKDALAKSRAAGQVDPYTLYSIYRGDWNDRRPCSALPEIDIALWKEN